MGIGGSSVSYICVRSLLLGKLSCPYAREEAPVQPVRNVLCVHVYAVHGYVCMLVCVCTCVRGYICSCVFSCRSAWFNISEMVSTLGGTGSRF